MPNAAAAAGAEDMSIRSSSGGSPSPASLGKTKQSPSVAPGGGRNDGDNQQKYWSMDEIESAVQQKIEMHTSRAPDRFRQAFKVRVACPQAETPTAAPHWCALTGDGLALASLQMNAGSALPRPPRLALHCGERPFQAARPPRPDVSSALCPLRFSSSASIATLA